MNGGGGQDDGHLGTPPPGLFITLILTRLVTRDTLSVETKHFIEEINKYTIRSIVCQNFLSCHHVMSLRVIMSSLSYFNIATDEQTNKETNNIRIFRDALQTTNYVDHTPLSPNCIKS